MEVNEKIHLEKYNPRWKFYYQQELTSIQNAVMQFASNDSFHIEHIGSTAVSGMVAKPIIDILVGVNTFPPNDLFINGLTSLRYIFMKDASVPERLYFIKRGDEISYNVHIVKYKDAIWKYDIGFRSYFRTHPNKVKEYSKLKESIYKRGAITLLEYSEQKANYITQILKEI